MNKKYYFKATGSTCYDDNGVTFPKVVKPYPGKPNRKLSSWVSVVLNYNVNTNWEYLWGLTNCPKVLTFTCSDEDFETIKRKFDQTEMSRFMIVREMN